CDGVNERFPDEACMAPVVGMVPVPVMSAVPLHPGLSNRLKVTDPVGRAPPVGGVMVAVSLKLPGVPAVPVDGVAFVIMPTVPAATAMVSKDPPHSVEPALLLPSPE